MKIKILLVVIFLASAAGLRAATNDLTSLLQQGLFDEEANHDLTSAIADYQSLATQFDRDRQVAATAIYRLGECYRKLGQTNGAMNAYQRIIKEFGEQQDLVTLSRQNLTGLGPSLGRFQEQLRQIINEAAARTNNPAEINSTAPAAGSLREQLEMVRNLETMTNLDDVIQIAPTVLKDETLINLINQYNMTDLDLMRARVTARSLSADANDQNMTNRTIREDRAIEKEIAERISARLAGLEKALTMELREAGSHGPATPAGQTSEAPSSLGRIYVWGAVRTQGPIELRRNENLTAGEAILSAGGFGDFANKKQVKLIRATSGTNENKIMILDMEQILEKGDARKDVVLEPGDHIQVPSKLFKF